MIVTAEAAKCGSVRVLALDAATGETVRDRRLPGPAAGHNITMALLAVDGMVMVGRRVRHTRLHPFPRRVSCPRMPA